MVRARGQAGFTLIELTVSLVAGLIVALGIVGMSRDATHTFHEEMRSSSAEANLRTGIDRLRADLARAGYMSTGNVQSDLKIARAPGSPPIGSGFTGLARLTSLVLNQGGSAAQTPLSAIQTPTALNPDMLDIAGNMTSTDQYEIATIESGASMCGGQRIHLNAQSPSMFRVLGHGAAAGQELSNIFQPTPAGVQGRFIVRIVDKTGFAQFVITCDANPVGIDGAGTPWVDIEKDTPVQMAKQTGLVGGLNGYGTGSLINPVHIVRWELRPATAEPAQYNSGSPLAGQPLNPLVADPAKYDLLRSYVDAKTGNVIDATTEVVAEYAVDFEVAFTVDTGLNAAQPVLVTFPFGAAVNNRLWGQDIILFPPPPNTGPQRIRSVRVRLATRAAEPDRTDKVDVLNPVANQPFLYRYCVVLGGCTTGAASNNALQFARVRTVTTEVALVNQARSY